MSGCFTSSEVKEWLNRKTVAEQAITKAQEDLNMASDAEADV
jgi:hypothetical protein